MVNRVSNLIVSAVKCNLCTLDSFISVVKHKDTEWRSQQKNINSPKRKVEICREKEEVKEGARACRNSPVTTLHAYAHTCACLCVRVQAGVCTSTTLTMRCTDEGERDSALPALLMNDLTFVLVTGKNLEGRATAQNNAALVNLSATQALVSSYWETVTLETEHSKKQSTGSFQQDCSSLGTLRKPKQCHYVSRSHQIQLKSGDDCNEQNPLLV